MIEYLYDCIRATAGQDACVCASITDDLGECITDACSLMLHDDEALIVSVDGALVDDVWEFIIPADATANLHGRYWYCICCGNTNLCFKQPIYLV